MVALILIKFVGVIISPNPFKIIFSCLSPVAYLLSDYLYVMLNKSFMYMWKIMKIMFFFPGVGLYTFDAMEIYFQWNFSIIIDRHFWGVPLLCYSKEHSKSVVLYAFKSTVKTSAVLFSHERNHFMFEIVSIQH